VRRFMLRSLFASTAFLACAPSAMAQERPVLLKDSFPIGDANGVLCQVQDRSVANPARRTMFDRSWAIVCRDSAVPVATIYAFDNLKSDPLELIAPHRREAVDCSAGQSDADGVQNCTVEGTQLGWSVIQAKSGNVSYIAEGFAAYEGAATMALQSLIENAPASGTIDIATTSIADPFAFARVQAGTLGEFLINRALQKSNLKEFGEADRLFIEAEPLNTGQAIPERLQRNFEAIHLINQGFFDEALERVRKPLSLGVEVAAVDGDAVEISKLIAARMNADAPSARMLGFVDDLSLSPTERAEIIDAQALQLAGTSLRILGQREEARRALLDSYSRAIAVRDGRVVTIVRLRAQIMGELAALSEADGDKGQAESYLRYAIEILESLGKRDAAAGFANQLVPYFRYLAPLIESDAALAEDYFQAKCGSA